MLVRQSAKSSPLAVVNATDAWMTVDDIALHRLNDELKGLMKRPKFPRDSDRRAVHSRTLNLFLSPTLQPVHYSLLQSCSAPLDDVAYFHTNAAPTSQHTETECLVWSRVSLT